MTRDMFRAAELLLSIVPATNTTKGCFALFCSRFAWNVVKVQMCIFSIGIEHSSYLSRTGLSLIWVSYRLEMERDQQLFRETSLWPVLICVAHYFCDILWTMNSCNEQQRKVSTFSFPGLLLLPLGNCSLPSTHALILCQLVQRIDFSLYAALQTNDIQELSPVMRFLGLWFI